MPTHRKGEHRDLDSGSLGGLAEDGHSQAWREGAEQRPASHWLAARVQKRPSRILVSGVQAWSRGLRSAETADFTEGDRGLESPLLSRWDQCPCAHKVIILGRRVATENQVLGSFYNFQPPGTGEMAPACKAAQALGLLTKG